MRLNRTLPVLLAGLVGSVALGACSDDNNSPSHPVVDLVSCPPTFAGGDGLTRAIYVDSFPGTSLKSVTGYFDVTGSGTRTVALTARDATYDGSVIGTDTVSFSAADGDSSVAVVFDLGNNPVTLGSTVTFTYASIADTGGAVFQQTTTSNNACPVIETEASTPPLDVFRRNGMALLIRGAQ